MTIFGLLHPGEMGAAVGGALRARGGTVLWASAGRSAATVERAREAGFEDVGEVAELCRRSEVVLSICPPHAAVDVARAAHGFNGIYVDANAVSPQTARAIADIQGRFVDDGIVGPPPHEPGTTRLYLSGREAEHVAGLFADTNVDARVISGEPGGPRRSRPPTPAGRRGAPLCFSPCMRWRRRRESRTSCWPSGASRCRSSRNVCTRPPGRHSAKAGGG